MRIYYTPKFKREYKKLPPEIWQEAKRCEKIFRQDPRDHRLKTHKLKGKLRDYWSFSVTHKHRIVFKFLETDLVAFHFIGDHSVYR